jgi:hypothetical protein
MPTLARMLHKLHAATLDMVVLPGVLGCRLLRRTVQVRLGFDLGFRISDLGFLTTIYNIQFSISDFAICSLASRIFQLILNPHAAIRILQSSIRWPAHLHGLATSIHKTSGL